eukprot:4282617-Pyramimonas_sp.AAC.1
MRGADHIWDRAGFSIYTGTPHLMHKSTTRQLKVKVALPAASRPCSACESKAAGVPIGWSRERSG